MTPNKDESTHESPCSTVVRLDAEVKNLKESDKSQWGAIKEIEKRLPVWATVAFAGLSSITTFAITYAALTAKIAEMVKK